MHGSVMRIGRLLVVAVLVAGFAGPALAGPKESSAQPHGDTKPPEGELVHDNGTTPVPVPEGEPDDYMDVCESEHAFCIMVGRVDAMVRWLSWLAR